MSTFPVISDAHLLQALIRRLEVRQNGSDHAKMHEGAPFDSLHKMSVESTLFTQDEFDAVMRELVKDNSLTLLGRLSFHDGADKKIKKLEYGRIATLHMEATVCEHQFFTENWTPIPARRTPDTGRRLYPTDDMSFYRLKILSVYITADGLPETATDAVIIFPVN